MIPPKLKKGDEVRIVAPATTFSIISQANRKIARERLEKLGLRISFAKHAELSDEFESSPGDLRVADLHDAFSDANVRMVQTAIGGYNSNQLLRHIDYDLIARNPKILCGYSDITALANAIYAKTGLVTYNGPHFSTFGMQKGFEYIEDYFRKCLFLDGPFEVVPSEAWSDDEWYKDQENRVFVKNEGPYVINEGRVEGTIIGGNLSTFALLHGTGYLPSLENTILFLEESNEYREGVYVHYFDRLLQSIIHQPDFGNVLGIIFGRHNKNAGMTKEKMRKVVETKRELRDILVIADVDFGHTTPLITYPIGGRARITAQGKKTELEILEH